MRAMNEGYEGVGEDFLEISTISSFNMSIIDGNDIGSDSSDAKNTMGSDTSTAELDSQLEDLKYARSSSPIEKNELDETIDEDKHDETFQEVKPNECNEQLENNIVEFQFNKELNDFDKDPVSIFLESPVDSGGGDMVPERFDFCKENNVLTVEFESAETKAEVLKRSSLRFKDYVLYVNDPIGKKDFASDNSVMILENVAQSEEDSVVTMYAQNMANEKPAPFNKVVETKLSKMFNDTFILKFESDFDPTVVDKRIKRKPKIHDREVKRINAFKSNMAILRDPDYRELKTKIDSIESFLKGLKHPDDSEKAVEFKTLRLFEPYLVIRFTWETDLKVLLNSEPEIDGRKYCVEYLYNKETLDDDIKKSKEPGKRSSSVPLKPDLPAVVVPPNKPMSHTPQVFSKDFFKNKLMSTEYQFDLNEILEAKCCDEPNNDQRLVKVVVDFPNNSTHYTSFLQIDFQETIVRQLDIKHINLNENTMEMSGAVCNLNKVLNKLKNVLSNLKKKELETGEKDLNQFLIKSRKTVSDKLKSNSIRAIIQPSNKNPIVRILSANSDDIEKCILFIKSVKVESFKIAPSKISDFKLFLRQKNLRKGEFIFIEIPDSNDEFKIVGLEPQVTEMLQYIQEKYSS